VRKREMSRKKDTINRMFRTVILALCTILTSALHAQSSSQENHPLTAGDTLVDRVLPMPVPDSSYLVSDYIEIHFKLDNADLDISYMDNGIALMRMERVIDSIGIDNIKEIEIVSQSSPEGPYERNKKLTEQRSKVMVNYMYRVFPELKEKITVNKITEAWDNLSQYVEQDPNLEYETKQTILDIIHSDELSLDVKKSRLKKTLGENPKTGDVYKYLTTFYYPVIRNSGMYILHIVEPIQDLTFKPDTPYIHQSVTNTSDIAYQPQQILPEESRKRPVLAVKTNLLYDAFFTKDMGWAPIYNIEAELYPTENGRWTWLLEYEFPWHSIPSKHQYLQMLNLQFEGRRYFKENSHHSGHYLSAYIGANYFDFCFDKEYGHGYQGEGGGLGLGYGYVLPLGKNPETRWKLELFIKAGIYYALYDPYDAGNPFAGKYYYDWNLEPERFRKRNKLYERYHLTGGGISISYDLIRKKVKNHPNK